jgi:hypothetical protein
MNGAMFPILGFRVSIRLLLPRNLYNKINLHCQFQPDILLSNPPILTMCLAGARGSGELFRSKLSTQRI